MKSDKRSNLIKYGIGDAGQAMMGTFVGFYQLYYFSDILRLSLSSIAGVFLLTKIIDCASFPLFGFLLDRTPGGLNRLLRQRLWLLIPFFIVSVLLFTYDERWSSLFRVIYAYLFVGLFVVMTAIISVVYTALTSAISLQARERANLSTIRFIFAFGFGAIATFSVQYVVDAFGGKTGGGFQAVAFIFSMIAAGTLYATGSVSIETRADNRQSSLSAHDSLMILVDPMVIAPVVATFFTGLFVAIKSQTTLYFITYVMRRDDIIGLMLGCGTVSGAIGVIAVGFLINKVDRKLLYMALMGASAISIALTFIIDAKNVAGLIFLQCISSMLGSACSPVIFSIYSDLVDYLDDTKNVRAPGIINSFAMLSGRLGGSLGMVMTPLALSLFAYRAGELQTPYTATGIALLFTIIPAALAGISALVMNGYKLTNKASDRISARLSEQTA